MSGELQRHSVRLAVTCAGFAASTVVYGSLVFLVLPPAVAPMTQARHLLWVFAVLALLNLVTLTPVYRAMLAGPCRVYAAGQQLGPLLRAHFSAILVLFARLEAIAIFGLVLFVLTGRQDWFVAFAAIALAGMLALWPTRDRTRSTLGLTTSAAL